MTREQVDEIVLEMINRQDTDVHKLWAVLDTLWNLAYSKGHKTGENAGYREGYRDSMDDSKEIVRNGGTL